MLVRGCKTKIPANMTTKQNYHEVYELLSQYSPIFLEAPQPLLAKHQTTQEPQVSSSPPISMTNDESFAIWKMQMKTNYALTPLS